jgi:hypothetical protein
MGEDRVWLQGRREEIGSLIAFCYQSPTSPTAPCAVPASPTNRHRRPIVPQHLREAAQRRHDQATERATAALARLSAAGAAISFASVAREADVSTDFLYRQPELRQRIQQMRTTNGRRVDAATTDNRIPATASAPVRALSTQLKELRRRHRDEITALQHALAVAQGENLAMRRKLAAYD